MTSEPQNSIDDEKYLAYVRFLSETEPRFRPVFQFIQTQQSHGNCVDCQHSSSTMVTFGANGEPFSRPINRKSALDDLKEALDTPDVLRHILICEDIDSNSATVCSSTSRGAMLIMCSL